MPKISRNCSKLMVFFIKKLISLIERRRTKRGSTVYVHPKLWHCGKLRITYTTHTLFVKVLYNFYHFYFEFNSGKFEDTNKKIYFFLSCCIDKLKSQKSLQCTRALYLGVRKSHFSASWFLVCPYIVVKVQISRFWIALHLYRMPCHYH